MKKLIALIGAVATAFGLYAAGPADYYGNSFESSDEGVQSEVWSLQTLWSTTLTDEFKVGAYEGGELTGIYKTGAQRRDGSDEQTSKFINGADNANYLKLETGTNVLDRALTDLATTGDKFYFDQLVKFTGFEEEPTFAADTKIAVWMSAIEQEGTPQIGTPQIGTPAQGVEGEEGYVPASEDYQPASPDYQPASEDYQPASDDYIAGETNLYVQVGTGAESISVQIDPASVGETEFAVDKWYRITIKSIGNIIGTSGQDVESQLGFLVFINGKQASIVGKPLYHTVADALRADAAKYYAAGQLFTAIDTTTVALAKIGYQGIGAIDDVVLSASSPDFDMLVDVEIDSLALTGAKVIKIGDVTITDQTSIKVKPGDILVSYAANGPYIVRNGENVKWTFEDGKFVRVQEASTIEIIEAAAVLNKTDYKAADELYGLLVTTGLENGDNLEFLTGVAIKESEQAASVYEFSAGTKIDVTIKNNETIWMIESVTPGDWVIDNAGAAAGFAKYYTLADEYSAVALTGEVAGLVQADYLSVGDGVITITGEGKVITLDDSLEIYDGENLITPKLDEETGYYTYALATEPTEPTTGFMVIIAGQTKGDVYETLAAAVDAAQDGSTIKLLSDETVASKCEITKNITLDLNGKTLARDNNAATLFVIKDVTLTINGATAGSTLVGRLNVGDSVYNGGVRTAHWDGALVINGGTYSVGDGQTVIHVNGDCLDAAVTINNATLTSPTDNGVQFNGKGTFAINNSTINGATAVYMKAGTLTIDKDSVINATAKTWTAPVANHNGSNPTGDAIVMDSITGYQGAISLTVADGATVTKVAEDAATIRETITDATESTTVKIDAPTIGGIALTEAFLAKVANGSAQLPGYVAAIGTVPYQTLQEAFDVGGNVTLLQDVAVRSNVKAGKTVVLDLNNKKIETEGTALGVSGTLTISGGTVAGLFPIAAFDGAVITVANGTYTGVEAAIWCDKGANVTIEDGVFTATDNAVIRTQGNADKGGNTIVINGGIFNGSITSSGYIACGIYVANADVVQVNGGTWNITGGCGICVRAGVTTVNGGTWNVSGDATGKVGDKTALISCVTFVEDFTDPQYPGYNAETDGIFVPAVIGETVNTVKAKTDFTAFLSGDGYEVAGPDEQGYYTVAQSIDPVAKIGDNKFATIEAAVAAATANATIALLANVALANALLVDGKTLTVDLKGFTITPSEKFTDTYIVSIENKANVTLTNGTINLLGKNLQVKTGATATVAANTTVTGTATYMTRVWDGTLNVYGTIYHNGGSGAAVQSLADGGVINVYDGALVSAGGESNPIRCNFNDGAATINIYGGTLETRGAYNCIYAYKSGNKSVINVYGGTFIGGWEQGQGKYNGAFYIITNDVNTSYNCEVTVTPLTDACKAKFNTDDTVWGDPLAGYCAPGYGPVKGDDGYYTIQRVYNVTIAETKNGTVETSVTNNIVAGTEVTITATPADNYELESITTNGTAITGNTFVMPADNVTVAATFKSTAQPGVEPGTVVEAKDEQDAIAKAAEMVIVPGEGDAEAKYYKGAAKLGSDGKWYVEADVNPALVTAEIKTVEEEKPIEVTATEFKAVVKDPIPGLFYGFVATDALGGTNEFAPVVESFVRATNAGVTLTAPKGEGNAKFFKISVRAKAPVAAPGTED